MASNLRVLLVAVLLFSICVGGAVWWLGMPLVRLAYLDGARDEPYVVIDLYEGIATSTYRASVQQALDEEVPHTLGPAYQLSHLIEGRREDAVDYLQVVAFGAAADVVQWLTDAGYRDVATGVGSGEFNSVHLGAYQNEAQTLLPRAALPSAAADVGLDSSGAWPGVILLVLTRASGTDDMVPAAEASGAVAVLNLLQQAENHMQPMLGTRVSDLGGATGWQYAMLFGFSDEASALRYLRGADAQTARALIRSSVLELALGVYVRRDADSGAEDNQAVGAASGVSTQRFTR